ncbi:hypothetical protein FO519_001162 [Halicephalobus sp. NKZ332]|nr:hypothetical protein FO519_001162 [Halicephalobus sp. NKZ332]
MKTYIAVCMTMELKAASKLVETIRALVNRLLLEEHVHCALLSIGKETKLACHFMKKVDDETVKKEVDKLHFNGEADLFSLMDYFNPGNGIVEDGYCFVFCDRFQQVPDLLKLRLGTVFGVFYDLQKYPVFHEQPSWDSSEDPVTPSSSEIFVNEICSVLKPVTGLFFKFPDGKFFTSTPFPRMPQRALFDDPELIQPLDWRPPEVPEKRTSIMELEGFLPETSMNSLTGRGCTYFLRPGDEKPKPMFRKHVFSYDVHMSFINKECMEMALNRINRVVKRESDESIVKRELLIATRQMAVSCHSIFASGLLSIIKNHIATVPRELTNFYKTIERMLMTPEGLKGVVLYLEKLVPNSRIKIGLY